MPRQLPNRCNTPPNGWRYQVPETGKQIGPFSAYDTLHKFLGIYYHSVGYEMPADIQQVVEKFICDQEPEYCGEAPPPGKIEKMVTETKHTFHAALQCLRVLVSNRAGSGERPSLQQQEARAQVCVQCPENDEIAPCSICNIKSLKSLIEKLAGAKKTSVDSKLKFCKVCHCANSAKVATKLEALWTHMPERQRNALPSTCWIKVEQAAKDNV